MFRRGRRELDRPGPCGVQALKRNAESLVGRDDTADAWHAQEAQQFRQRVSTELERVSLFYTKHERKMCRFFCVLEEKADALISSLDEEAVALCSDGAGSYEERLARQSARSAALVQEPNNRQVFRALTGYSTHIDTLRNFALLNTLALLKIANHHCQQPLRDDIIGRLCQEPFYNCHRLTSLVEEIQTMADALLTKCFGDVLPLSSRQDGNGRGHVSPTVGRTCRWRESECACVCMCASACACLSLSPCLSLCLRSCLCLCAFACLSVCLPVYLCGLQSCRACVRGGERVQALMCTRIGVRTGLFRPRTRR